MDIKFDEATYLEMEQFQHGICTECGELSGTCEPDAEGYECEHCGAHALIGSLSYLMEYGDAG